MQLIRRYATLSAHSEQIESDYVLGKQLDVSEYTAIVLALTRVGSRIGLNRVARDVTPMSPLEYARTRSAP